MRIKFMRRIVATLSALVVAGYAIADPGATVGAVDLRGADALLRLKESNPEHFDRIRQILLALLERPQRAEKGWLQTNFAARDVALSGLFLNTSYPPKQVLQFTLDDTRYTLYLRRPDMDSRWIPAR
jgi:hypothetical protein